MNSFQCKFKRQSENPDNLKESVHEHKEPTIEQNWLCKSYHRDKVSNLRDKVDKPNDLGSIHNLRRIEHIFVENSKNGH